MVSKVQPQLRLRVFAGPNGSGKSTIIKSIRENKENGREIDFGVYINADDIAVSLKTDKFSFRKYGVKWEEDLFDKFVSTSGLLTDEFTLEILKANVEVKNAKLILLDRAHLDRIAQIVARFLRELLLSQRKRFSFETVFSHESNLEIMKRAVDAGYKVYLYFVATESPEINKYRVALRVRQKGHAVPPDRIEKRYYRALSLLYAAAELSYQCFFFDNSDNERPFKVVGHFKKNEDGKVWDKIAKSNLSNWFQKYYLRPLRENNGESPEIY